MTHTRHVHSFAVTAALASIATLAAACESDASDPSEATTASTSSAVTPVRSVAALPCFEATPNIAAAAATRLPPGTWVRALYHTESGAQIYRCDRNAAGAPVWALRSPLAHLIPSRATERRLGQVALAYHHRDDLGGLVSPPELAALGLVDAAGATITAPVWVFTFAAPESPVIAEEREIVAGRVLAQDVVGTGNIPNLLLEVRGRSVAGLDQGVVVSATSAADPALDPIASSDYLLRWNLRGGVAPAAALCTEATLGTESQQPYQADYYFLETTPLP
jgi:hypothetical protein